MDLSDNGSECEGISNRTPPFDGVSSDGSNLKTCVDCGTSKTPLWRGGPAGPKSLCNACGIRSRKKRRVLMGVTKEEKKIKKCPSLSPRGHNSSSNSGGHSCSTSSSGGDGGDSFPLKNRPWGGGSHLGLQKPRSNTNRKKKLGEEEQAAFLLLALSCGSVYG